MRFRQPDLVTLTEHNPPTAAIFGSLKGGDFAVEPNAAATTTEVGWSPRVCTRELDPTTIIDAYVENPYEILALAGPPA